jgi:hypothetical protein
MLRRDDVAFLKALTSTKVSPALLRELKRIVAEKKKRRGPAVPVGRRGPDGPDLSHHPPKQLAAKRRAAEMAGSGGSPEPAARRLVTDADSVRLPASTSRATGERADTGGQQLVSP